MAELARYREALVEADAETLYDLLEEGSRPNCAPTAAMPMRRCAKYMSTVRVEASRSYDVAIDEYSIDEAGVLAASIGGDAAFVVSDSNVAPLYLERVARSLSAAGFEPCRNSSSQAGEASKNTRPTGHACRRWPKRV